MSADGHVSSDIHIVSGKAISGMIECNTELLVYTINIVMNVSSENFGCTTSNEK